MEEKSGRGSLSVGEMTIVVGYLWIISWRSDWHDSKVFHQKFWICTSVHYRIKEIFNVQKLYRSILKVNHQSISNSLETSNSLLRLSPRAKCLSNELTPFNLLTNYVNLVILLLDYSITIVNVNLGVGLHEKETLVADVLLNISDWLVHRNLWNCIENFVSIELDVFNKVGISDHNKTTISLNFLNVRTHFDDDDVIFFAVVENYVLVILDENEMLTALSEEHNHTRILVISSRCNTSLICDHLI